MEWTGFIPLGLSDDEPGQQTTAPTYGSPSTKNLELKKWIERTKRCETLSEDDMVKLCKKVDDSLAFLTLLGPGHSSS